MGCFGGGGVGFWGGIALGAMSWGWRGREEGFRRSWVRSEEWWCGDGGDGEAIRGVWGVGMEWQSHSRCYATAEPAGCCVLFLVGHETPPFYYIVVL